VVTLGTLTALLAAGQQPGKVYRTGVVAEAKRSEVIEDRWRTALRQKGYVEGQNLVLHFASARYRGVDKQDGLSRKQEPER
jgi:hypothetical protein